MNTENPKTISPKALYEWITEESDNPFLIDVREDTELDVAPFPFEVLHLPLSRISVWSENISQKLPSDKALVVICHSGIRSLNFGIWLLHQGFHHEIWNLEGGIDLWSLEVDNSVPRY
tara:strand:+ start:67 stop:420 length:354 start_codon:yes stop_codon:yes gene_type:complete